MLELVGTRIDHIIWPEDRVDHIDRHAVTPGEFEEACFGQALIQRTKQEGESPVYYFLGKHLKAGIYFVSLFNFQMAKAILSLHGP